MVKGIQTISSLWSFYSVFYTYQFLYFFTAITPDLSWFSYFVSSSSLHQLSSYCTRWSNGEGKTVPTMEEEEDGEVMEPEEPLYTQIWLHRWVKSLQWSSMTTLKVLRAKGMMWRKLRTASIWHPTIGLLEQILISSFQVRRSTWQKNCRYH